MKERNEGRTDVSEGRMEEVRKEGRKKERNGGRVNEGGEIKNGRSERNERRKEGMVFRNEGKKEGGRRSE